jgi:hypothetical protein
MVAGPLNNGDYDKIKILHELSSISWFIKKHALEDLPKDTETFAFLKQLESSLEKHVAKLKDMVCK